LEKTLITKLFARANILYDVPKIIFEQQRGFIPGREIQDCIIVASEAVNQLHKKVYGVALL